MDGANELARSPAWRLSARPNPWDVQMAFDNSPVTRWRSWEVARPGMFVEVDFGDVQRVGSVMVESSDEGYQTKIKLEGMDQRGQWTTLLDRPAEFSLPTRVNLRRAASEELKARGIHYIMVERDDIRSEDFQTYTSLWGMKCIGQWKSIGWLYHIE